MKNSSVIDTHEHVQSINEVRKQGLDVFRVFKNSYARLDFISAGMSENIWESDNEDEIWDEFKEYQESVSQTEYYNNVIMTLDDLYGLPEKKITEENYKILSEKIRNSYKDDNWYKKIYREKGNIKTGLLDTFWSIEKFSFDRELFRPVFRVDAFIKGKNFTSLYEKKKSIHSTLERIAAEWDMDIDNTDSILALMDEGFKRFTAASAAAVKIAIAYHRPLFFENVSRKEAENSFYSDSAEKAFQDYIAHEAIKRAEEFNLPVQIHTGILARNTAEIKNTDPLLLNNLFNEYPGVNFVLFHFGYPFVDNALTLAKTFQNVYIDLCWVSVISKQMAVASLDKALDMVPFNKIMWGGDAYRIEDAYGALRTAREVVAEVLSMRIERGRLDAAGAEKIARAIFYDNAAALYKLS